MRRFFCGESEYRNLSRDDREISLWRRIVFGYLFLPLILTLLIILVLVPDFNRFLIDQLGSPVVIIVVLAIFNFVLTVLLYRTSIHCLYYRADDLFEGEYFSTV